MIPRQFFRSAVRNFSQNFSEKKTVEKINRYLCPPAYNYQIKIKPQKPKKQKKVKNNRRFSTLNRYSSVLTQDETKGAAQAMLRAVGLKRSDYDKPQVGIASMWYEGNPCNAHLNKISKSVKDYLERYETIGYIFNTIGVSDGISMGTSGMRYSLPSREIIADSIETVMQAQHYDANICIPGCDKNIPASLMAMIRVNRPSIMMYGGTIAPGCHKGKNIDVVDAFQSYGKMKSGEIDETERNKIIDSACPGHGSCGGMYTANTMAICAEAMGMSLPNSSSNPAESIEKRLECSEVSHYIKVCLENDLKPSDILTKKSFENAIAITMALGGSTNSVLHLLAIAHTANIDLTLDDFQRISDRTPYIGNLKPSGQYHMIDLYKNGGTSTVIRYLIESKLMDGDTLTVTGNTLWDNVMHFQNIDTSKKIIYPVNNPIRNRGHIQILYGNLAPEGSVSKITGKEGDYFKGIAKVYDSEKEMLEGLKRGDIKKGEKTVIVIRYVGPVNGPGMPEMLEPTSTLVGMGLEKDCALITDGRFSGGSHGFIIGHITPEAGKYAEVPWSDKFTMPQSPIADIENGDIIEIDVNKREINNLTYDVDKWYHNTSCIGGRMGGGMELKEGKKHRKNNIPEKNVTGYLKKFQKSVSSASTGCVTV